MNKTVFIILASTVLFFVNCRNAPTPFNYCESNGSYPFSEDIFDSISSTKINLLDESALCSLVLFKLTFFEVMQIHSLQLSVYRQGVFPILNLNTLDGRFTDCIVHSLKQVKPNDRVVIEHIRMKDKDGLIRTFRPVIIKAID